MHVTLWNGTNACHTTAMHFTLQNGTNGATMVSLLALHHGTTVYTMPQCHSADSDIML